MISHKLTTIAVIDLVKCLSVYKGVFRGNFLSVSDPWRRETVERMLGERHKRNRSEEENTPRPVSNLIEAFQLRLALMPALRDYVLGGTGVNLQQAQFLVELYGARYLDKWRPQADPKGWVPLKAVISGFVHDTGNPAQVSRTIAELGEPKTKKISGREVRIGKGLIEEPGEGDEPENVPPNGKALRITSLGTVYAIHIWNRYLAMAELVTEGIKPDDLQTHVEVSQKIEGNIRKHQDLLKFPPEEDRLDTILQTLKGGKEASLRKILKNAMASVSHNEV